MVQIERRARDRNAEAALKSRTWKLLGVVVVVTIALGFAALRFLQSR